MTNIYYIARTAHSLHWHHCLFSFFRYLLDDAPRQIATLKNVFYLTTHATTNRHRASLQNVVWQRRSPPNVESKSTTIRRQKMRSMQWKMTTAPGSTLPSPRTKIAWDLELPVIALLPGQAKLPTIPIEIIKRQNLMPFYITW